MDSLLSFISILLLVAVSHAALAPQEIYWKSVLPNTPMPNAISDLLPDSYVDEKSTYVGVGGKQGVNVNTGGKGRHTGVNVGYGGVHVNTGPYKGRNGGTNVNVGHGGVNVHTGPYKGKPPVSVHVGPKSPFDYEYAATKTQIHDDPNVALFFLEDNLFPGKKFSVLFTKTTSGTTFVPHQVAKSVPFSSSKFPEILEHFSVKPESEAAIVMKKTIKECELPSVSGERKYCATSLESMVDFSVSSLGSNKLAALSTRVSKEESKPQVYTITRGGVKGINAGSELVACHPENYVYAVFYCHATTTSKAYTVELAGVDGAKVEAVAVCHTNTKDWNPEHVAFKALKVKPGTVPVCHFVPQDHVVWARST